MWLKGLSEQGNWLVGRRDRSMTSSKVGRGTELPSSGLRAQGLREGKRTRQLSNKHKVHRGDKSAQNDPSEPIYPPWSRFGKA